MKILKRQRSIAFFLVICMVVTLFTGIPARAEEMVGLMVKDWIDWDDEGVPSVNPEANFTNETGADLCGTTLYLGYVENKGAEATGVAATDITVQYNGETATEEQVTYEANPKNGQMIDFTFYEVGDYKLTYRDSFVTVHVGYPEVGFYTADEKSSTALIRDGEFGYTRGGDNKFYMILHKCEYAKLDTGNIIYQINGETPADISEYLTITVPDNLPTSTDAADYLTEADYVYEIQVNKQENFDFRAEVQKTDVLDGDEEGTYKFAEESYPLDRSVFIREKIEGLVTADRMEWNDNGPFVPSGAEFTKETGADLYGSIMYLGYVETEGAESTVVKADEITVQYYNNEQSSWIDAAALVTKNQNEANEELVDFTFKEVGDYTLTYRNSSVTVHVDYPEVGFYTANEKSSEALIRDRFEYKENESDTFYMILHNYGYAKLDTANIAYKVNGEELENISEYLTVTVPANLPTSKDPRDYLGEADYVYTIKINKQERFDFRAEVQKTDVVEEGEGTYGFAEESYLLDRSVFIREKLEGLVATDWIVEDEENNNYPSVDPNAELEKELWADLLGRRIYLEYIESDENSSVVKGTDTGLSVQYEGATATTKEVEFEPNEQNGDLINFNFYKVGDYTLTYRDSSVTVHVGYPQIGFYETDEMTPEGFIRGIDYERMKGKTFYIIPNKQDDWADFSYKVMTENTYDDEVYVEVNGEALDADKELTDTAEVTITKDAKMLFGLKAVGTYTNEDGTPGDWNPEEYIECVDSREDVPTGIQIKTAPAKTAYKAGEKFDKTGMVVELVYEDESTQEITNSYTTAPTTALTKDDTEITVAYNNNAKDFTDNENFTAKQAIKVKAPTGIRIKTAPAKTSYTAGEKFDKTGMVVELVYSDDSTEAVTDYTVPDTALTKDDTKITVTYKNFTAEQAIKVKAPTGIRITKAPTKTSYTAGEKFDKTGMAVELVYSDNSTEAVTDYTVPTIALKETDKEIMVTYKGYTAKQAVTVKAAPAPVQPTTEAPVKTGETKTVNGSSYKVTSVADNKKAVTYTSGDKNATKITVPSTITINGTEYKVTAVADKAFSGCKKLTTVTISSNVTSIGKNAFSGCKKLTKVTIGKDVKTIGTNAFSGCSKLKTVSMGANVATIGDKAFYKCTALTKITIPAKVSKIGKQAFYGCKKLRNITIKTTKLTSKKVGSKAFKGIHVKATIKVPKKNLTSYKRILKAKGAGSKVKIKK